MQKPYTKPIIETRRPKNPLSSEPFCVEEFVSSLLQERMTATGIDDEEVFLCPDFSHLHDPFEFADMRQAVARILRAKENKERMVIFGDYDVDGVSGTALLGKFLRKTIGCEASWRLPHRVQDGYGFRPHFLPELAAAGVKLVITVDCGTRDIETVRQARELGIDVIITDHHAVPDEVPEGLIALLSPKLANSPYPFAHLSGSGMAFKLAHAIAKTLSPQDDGYALVSPLLDFAMLGTIADCMPLVGENRTIAALGLKQIGVSHSPALRQMVAGRTHSADLVGFFLWPRINAAGRLDSAYKALKLLLTEDGVDEIIAEIEGINQKRRLLTDEYVQDAMERVDISKHVLWYTSPDIEHGILGLVAGRLTENFGKPSIALKTEGEHLVASCRSPEHISIIKHLEVFRDVFDRFGGHKQAAGFTIQASHFEAFVADFEKHLETHENTTVPPKTIITEAELSLADITSELVASLRAFEPFGIGNNKPLFQTVPFTPTAIELLGKEAKHLKIRHPLGNTFDMLAFGFGARLKSLREAKEIVAVGELSEEEYNGKTKVSFLVREIII